MARIAARAPAQRPRALHRAHRLAAIGAANHFAHQHRACGPLAAEAKTLEAAHDQQLFEILGEAGQEGEERKPRDHDAQQARPADAVGEHARDPASEGGNHQGARRQQSGLPLGDAPDRNQRRDRETVNLHIERIERPAAEARPERPALSRSKLAIPIEHGSVWIDSRSDRPAPPAARRLPVFDNVTPVVPTAKFPGFYCGTSAAVSGAER